MSDEPDIRVTENEVGNPMLRISFPGTGSMELLLSNDQLWDLAAGSLSALPMEMQAEMAKEQSAVVWEHIRDTDE